MATTITLFFVFFLQGIGLIVGQKVCSITDFGAIGDGITLNTRAMTEAVSACSRDSAFDYDTSNKNTVLVPSGGTFLTGSFLMASGIDLHVEEGAMLLGSTSEEDYPLIDILPSYGTGRDVDSDLRYQPLIFGQNLTYVSVSGHGIIDGNGGEWWKRHFRKELEWSRPRLIEFMYSSNLIIEDLTLQNSAFWTVHPYASTNIVVQRLRILAPGYAPNTDGVDPDSCKNVVIQDCYFSVGDDGIAIKSGLNEYGRDFATPSENIYIRNITIEPQFDNLSTNGISIGSEMSGDVRNVTVENVTIVGCEAGIYIKTREDRGGVVEDIFYNNIVVRKTLQAIKFVMHYGYRRRLESIKDESDDNTLPHFRNIYVSNMYGEQIANAGILTGLEGSIMENVTLSNVEIHGGLGFYCNLTSGSYENVYPSMEDCFDN